MKIKKICAALALGGLVLALTACGNSGSSSSKAASAVQPTSQNGKYVPNPTGKPMSEDLKDQLESLHEKEAKSIDTIKELPAGSNKGKKIMIALRGAAERAKSLIPSSRKLAAIFMKSREIRTIPRNIMLS